jgi:hypothetical protein
MLRTKQTRNYRNSNSYVYMQIRRPTHLYASIKQALPLRPSFINMATPIISFQLRALNYSKADDFDPNNLQQFQSLVLWLENTKIRHYPIEGREHLNQNQSATWEVGFTRYLQDLDCPIAFDGTNHLEGLRWLLIHAGAPSQFERR